MTQPQRLMMTHNHPHITCLCIKGSSRYSDDEDEDLDEDNIKNRSRAERLRASFVTPEIHESCANISICSQTDNNHFSPTAIPTSNAKVHPSAEDVDNNLVDFLKNKEQNSSKYVLLESIMNFIVDKLQSNSEKDNGYKYTFLCGSEYLGQIMNDTHLTSLSFKNTDMTNDWLYNFAKHLPRSHIASLVLPKIIDHPQTSAGKYQKEDMFYRSHDDVNCRIKKTKITEDYTNFNEKSINNGLEYLASILKDTEIFFLDFGGNPVNLKMLSCSLVGSKLTSLSLRACKVQNDGLSFLARILKDTQINCIDLSENELDCQHMKIFVPGLEDTNITSLNLSSNKIGVDGMNCLASVLKTSAVATLDISDNNLNYNSLEVFLNCLVDSKITSLSLKNNDIGTDGLFCLGRLLKNTQITSLDLSGIEFNYERMEMFASCLVDTKVKFLGLENSSIDIDGLHMLLNVIENTRITSINLHNNDWDIEENPDGINRLECLVTNSQITSIDIGNGNCFNQFASSLIGSNITHLGLKEQNLTMHELELLGDVLKNSKITSIDLSDNGLDDESFKILVPFLVDSRITSLDLSVNHPYYDGINCLGAALKNTKITSLSLSNCCMRCNEMRHFVMYLPDSKIKSLDLSDNVICCNSFYLSFILKHTQITTLDISSKKFNVYNVDPVCFLEIFKSINTSLHLIDRNLCTTNWYFLARNLRNTEINSIKVTGGETDCEDLKYLCQGLVNSQVVDLDLTRNNIDCSRAHYLAEVLKHTRISSLKLAKNEIDDEGLKYLTKDLVGSQLKSLDLYQNFISNEGIQGLVESVEGTQLLELDLRDNRISSDAAYDLSESVEKSNLKSMQIQIDFRDKVYVCLNLFKYENCFIEIIECLSKKGIDDFVKKVYKRAGITQLILEGEEFPHLAGAFDNMDINEAVTDKCLFFDVDGLEVISCLENSNIGELKIDWCDLFPSSFVEMKVTALTLQNNLECGINEYSLRLSLIKSNIVYLDLSANEIGEIEFANLVDVLPGSKIISLNLSRNELGRSCMKLLAKVLPATNIIYINLDFNFIGPRGFKYLMNVAPYSKLCWLSLKNNGVEGDSGEVIQLSPFFVPRVDYPAEFQIRYLFKELVTLNSSTEQFEFILPHDGSHTTITDYTRLVKLLLDGPIYKMHIYDYFYMQNKRHSVHLLNSINVFVEKIQLHFISFFESNIMQLEEMFGYDSFVSLVQEFNSSNLTEFVEFLLLHRVLYYVDDEKNFLHPLVYKMLFEHKMPMFIEEMEPNKKQQIISYFEKQTDLEGAQEIIALLK